MKKLNLLLSALLALGVVSTALAQDAPARGQRGARQGAGQAIQRGLRQAERPALQRANLKPTLFADLGDECYTPDGMTISDETGMLYLSVPNFGRMDENMVKADSAQGGYLYEVDQEGKATRILEFPVLEKTGQAGPMGLDFGPDGNLYVCDNQYFHNPDYCSRILRVVFVDGKPTQEVQVAVEGLKLANGMTWFNGNLFVSDSYFDVELNDEQLLGSGGVLMFTADEITKAGKDGNPPLQIKSGRKTRTASPSQPFRSSAATATRAPTVSASTKTARSGSATSATATFTRSVRTTPANISKRTLKRSSTR